MNSPMSRLLSAHIPTRVGDAYKCPRVEARLLSGQRHGQPTSFCSAGTPFSCPRLTPRFAANQTGERQSSPRNRNPAGAGRNIRLQQRHRQGVTDAQQRDAAFAQPIKPLTARQRSFVDDSADATPADITGDRIALVQCLVEHRILPIGFAAHRVVSAP